MKLEWLSTNVRAAGSPARAESKIFRVNLVIFWLIQAAFVVGEPLCDLEIPFRSLIALLRAVQ